MPYYKRLVGDLCYLSPPSMEDADLWARWDTDLEVAIPLGDEAYVPTSLNKSREMLADSLKNQHHVYTIVDRETDKGIGRGMLFNMQHIDAQAMLGITIGEREYWNRGYGTDAVRLLVEYGFDLLNLHSIMLGVLAFNERAIRCYKKVGFREIGRRREARLIGGQWYDAVLMDILASEFESRYTRKLLRDIGLE